MQSPAYHPLQSPHPNNTVSRGPNTPQAQQNAAPFAKELMTTLNLLLNQLGEVERKGQMLFQKVDESYKHPYSQSEAMAEALHLQKLLDTMVSLAKSTGFGALSLPANANTASTPAATTAVATGMSMMSPAMRHSIGGGMTGTPAVATPRTAAALTLAAATATVVPVPASGFMIDTASNSTTATPMMMDGMTPGGTNMVGTPSNLGNNNNMMSPQGSNTVGNTMTPMSMTSPAGGNLADLMAGIGPFNVGTPGVVGLPAATPQPQQQPSLAQLVEAKQIRVQALHAEKLKLKTHLSVASSMVK